VFYTATGVGRRPLWRISGGKISSMETDCAAFVVNGEQHVFHSAAHANHLRAAVEATGT
jgi:hypothetical protein